MAIRVLDNWKPSPNAKVRYDALVQNIDTTQLDQFAARDIEVISTALRLYHGDLMDHGNIRGCEHVATLIYRINKPGRNWVAEVAE